MPPPPAAPDFDRQALSKSLCYRISEAPPSLFLSCALSLRSCETRARPPHSQTPSVLSPGTKLHHRLCQCDTSRELTPQTQGRDWRKEHGGAKRNTELGPRPQVLTTLYTPALLGSAPWGCCLTPTSDRDKHGKFPRALSLFCRVQAQDGFLSLVQQTERTMQIQRI